MVVGYRRVAAHFGLSDSDGDGETYDGCGVFTRVEPGG